ncbi:hypothetical protein NpPPO83_00000318 [Neofusicoccum parvum]|uniref:Uncharacterized protein n=1 Tax=Neofusicoccum parvum TaxID=310453 RepID=A0ACB5SPF6_9PEZI|nr:hypothetical protein NpPPO83_00000318 [Neofusicoccum parvum]
MISLTLKSSLRHPSPDHHPLQVHFPENPITLTQPTTRWIQASCTDDDDHRPPASPHRIPPHASERHPTHPLVEALLAADRSADAAPTMHLDSLYHTADPDGTVSPMDLRADGPAVVPAAAPPLACRIAFPCAYRCDACWRAFVAQGPLAAAAAAVQVQQPEVLGGIAAVVAGVVEAVVQELRQGVKRKMREAGGGGGEKRRRSTGLVDGDGGAETAVDYGGDCGRDADCSESGEDEGPVQHGWQRNRGLAEFEQ